MGAKLSERGPCELAAPTKPSDRLDTIDVLRGLARFGVLAINLEGEFRASIFHQFLPGDTAGDIP